MKRHSGVLMHVSSLNGDYSIGSFGKEARDFVDLLSESGFSYWQMLPFCMTDECNSPYKSYSAFGGNPFFIDLPTLHEKGLLTKEELDSARQEAPYLCEFERLQKERIALLARAAGRAKEDKALCRKISKFLAEHKELADAAKFLALKSANGDLPWYEWKAKRPASDTLWLWKFIQFEFFTEWMEIKAYANSKGVRLIGDVPIYVALDSADVWANRELFLLDERNRPTAVAGVPPDYFSEDGQLWGNPLYNWEIMKKDGYAWWCRRIEHMLTLFDGVRIDHFRGLEAYWSIPADAETAKAGAWVKGPAEEMVDKIREVAGDRLIIAEDLGDITKEVVDLLEYSGLPGMRVFQFAFLGDRETPHLPHNYSANCIAYTGTHDNNTLLGYIWECDDYTRRRIFSYCGYNGENWDDGCRAIIKAMFASHAGTVIFPIQDILLYGADTRMNTPGTSKHNWAFRITKEQLDTIDRGYFAYLNDLYTR